MSRLRILRIAIAFCAFALLLIGALAKLSVVDHDSWVERSLRNRWAFRDVPTRRGSILDREGRTLSFDVPGFDLELVYATFRRDHPLAACVHGANLLHAARGESAPYALRDPESTLTGLSELLDLPLVDLRSNAAWPDAVALDPPVEDVARDLRFYIGSIVAALTGAQRAKFAVALAAQVRDGARGTVGDAVARIAAGGRVPGFSAAEAQAGNGVELAIPLREALRSRIDELRTLDARLRRARSDRDDFDLFAFLEDRRLARIDAQRLGGLPADQVDALEDVDFWSYLREVGVDWHGWSDWRGWLGLDDAQRTHLTQTFDTERRKRSERRDQTFLDPESPVAPLFAELPEGWVAPRFEDEERPRRVLARLPHELASWLAMLAERHPGFALRASVLRARSHLEGHGDLGSLGLIVGRVGTYDSGGRTPEQDAAERLATEADFARQTDDALAGVALSERVEDSLRQRAESALRAHYGRLGRIGRSGVEASCDELLAGSPGLRFVERDKRSRELRMFESLDVAPGGDIELTVDVELQLLAEAALGPVEPGREKALVVLDARSGDVLALVALVWRKEDSEPHFSVGCYAPSFTAYVGSVAKPLVALSYLAARREDPALPGPESFPVCGGLAAPYDQGRHLRCGEVHGSDSRDTVRAIAESCNVYFFGVADGLGADRLRRCYATFGWDPGVTGDPSVAQQGAVSGLPRRMWSVPRLGPDGFQVPMQAIGYGLKVWPLFVARAYAGIATGALPEVRFVREPRPAAPRQLPFDPLDLRSVRDGMLACVTDGTARSIRASAERIRRETGRVLFGKTGTAEVTRDHRLHNGWFAGFIGEGDDARIAFAAVEYRTDDHGGTSAAPIVARFLDAVCDRPDLRDRVLGTAGGRR